MSSENSIICSIVWAIRKRLRETLLVSLINMSSANKKELAKVELNCHLDIIGAHLNLSCYVDIGTHLKVVEQISESVKLK